MNVHNFRIKVNAWVLLTVVLISTGLAAMGDLSSLGLSVAISLFLTKALPAMLTVCAAVFYSPDAVEAPISSTPVVTSAPKPTVPPTVTAYK